MHTAVFVKKSFVWFDCVVNIAILAERPIIVDWAVPKDLYRSSQKKSEVKAEVKEEVLSSDEEDDEDQKPPLCRFVLAADLKQSSIITRK